MRLDRSSIGVELEMYFCDGIISRLPDDGGGGRIWKTFHIFVSGRGHVVTGAFFNQFKSS